MPARPNLLFDRADVCASSVKDGEVRVNLGDSVSPDTSGIGQESGWWGLDGFLSRPNDPDGDGACQVIYLQDGAEKRVMASRDNRWSSKFGSPEPGDRGIVSNCDARVFVKKKDNEVVLFTANETDSKHPMMVDLNGKEGTLMVVNSGAIITLKKDSISLMVSGGGGITIDKDGVQIFGLAFAANASTVTLGLVGGQPPIPGLMSALIGPAGISGVPSKSVTIAP